MIPKPIRIVDKELLEAVKRRPCAVCNRSAPSDAHHIRTRGAGGGDTPENLVALCRRHHTEVHAIGPSSFLAKYPHVRFKMGLR